MTNASVKVLSPDYCIFPCRLIHDGDSKGCFFLFFWWIARFDPVRLFRRWNPFFV